MYRGGASSAAAPVSLAWRYSSDEASGLLTVVPSKPSGWGLEQAGRSQDSLLSLCGNWFHRFCDKTLTRATPDRIVVVSRNKRFIAPSSVPGDEAS